MNETNSRLAALGITIPEILLPQSNIDLSKWAVIACDQFTQDRNYWEAVKAKTDGAPSALNLIFPELYLAQANRESRIAAIRDSMEQYLKSNVFSPPRSCMIYIERSTPHHSVRRGLVLAVDLECYDWKPGTRPLIRATEETIEERLPPRMEIRRGAPLETPHILLLIDDEKDTLLPALAEKAKKSAPLYSAGLMMNSGSITGWVIDSINDINLLVEGLEKLAAKTASGASDGSFLFAMGDGNHSLATAKAVWEEYKDAHKHEAGIENHPARWALVELENLHDPGISFEPIHRIIFGVDPAELYGLLSAAQDIHCCPPVPGSRVIHIEADGFVSAGFQPLLDNFVKQNGLEIDYIHGEEELFRLVKDNSRPATGLLMPPLNKSDLFKTVARSGPLPRKSFSMGESVEKRFYLECRKLF
ncbi:MAG: DUF1015 domain-containing protein [Treponema sp.]|jgi:uncharacterized protein (DUF1015 family)|nr:DUF1015 domain-containing protein [Treponema sp.]